MYVLSYNHAGTSASKQAKQPAAPAKKAKSRSVDSDLDSEQYSDVSIYVPVADTRVGGS